MQRLISGQQVAELLSDWRAAGETGYRALADRLRLLIIDGRLPVGTRLPSERELVLRLGASRTTIGAALEELRTAGFLETRRGSGSVVRVPGGRPENPGGMPVPLDFTTASSGAIPGFHAAAERALRSLPAALSGTGYEFVGVPSLREAIATRFTERGLPTRPSQILITSGAQAAIALVSRVLLTRGDRAIVETPGYRRAHEALRSAGARLLPIAVDADAGWDIDEVERLLRRAAPALAYLMPDFHNPTGRSLPADGRRRILEAARDAGATVLVDETTAELDIDRVGEYLPMASFAPSGARVITVGSASKVIWGGLRIGWVRASEDLVARLASARGESDLGTAILDQLVAAEVFADFAPVLESRRVAHAATRDAIASGLRAKLPEWHVPRIDGGLATWVRFDAPVSSQLAIGARARGLRIPAGPWFGLDGAFERFLRIPFGPGPDSIDRAIDILAEVWDQVADVPRGIEQPLGAVV